MIKKKWLKILHVLFEIICRDIVCMGPKCAVFLLLLVQLWHLVEAQLIFAEVSLQTLIHLLENIELWHSVFDLFLHFCQRAARFSQHHFSQQHVAERTALIRPGSICFRFIYLSQNKDSYDLFIYRCHAGRPGPSTKGHRRRQKKLRTTFEGIFLCQTNIRVLACCLET